MINLPLNIDFSGKVVVVTGAGGLICGTMVKAFAQLGAKVAALDLNEDSVKKLADELKSEGFICEGYKANVLDPEALEEVHKAVLSDLGQCDIPIEIYDYDPSASDDLFETFKSKWNAIQNSDKKRITGIRTQKQIDTIDYAVNSGDIHSMIALIEFKGIGLKTMEQCFKLVMQSQPSQTLFD